MIMSKSLWAVPALLIISACAQPEPVPEPITPEPIYDKWGNDISGGGGCTGGQQAGASANCIPGSGQNEGYQQPGTPGFTELTKPVVGTLESTEGGGGEDGGAGAGTGN